MSIRIYNTLSGKKEVFKPLNPGKVNIYVCGVTVYDDCHLGHARAALVFDVVCKYLRHKGYDVKYVKNFTDVDDKIITRAAKEGIPTNELTEKYIASYKADMKKLGVADPSVEPKATENMERIVSMVAGLVEKGYAYESEGDVYFRIGKFSEYGKLSGRSTDDMLTAVRIEVNDKKENPLDFALWKSSKPGEPYWKSPWGNGRPGWHIECSAMSLGILGDTIDIHGGGKDLVFPHHENEIAQSEALTGKEFVRYWMHNGFVTVDEEKMSKSLGNFFTLKDIFRQYRPDVIRFFLLSTHYRSPIDFSNRQLNEAKKALNRIYNTVKSAKRVVENKACTGISAEYSQELEAVCAKFEEAMADDFNTAQAIGVIFSFIRRLNVSVADAENGVGSTLGEVSKGLELLLNLLGLLGLYAGEQNAKNKESAEPEDGGTLTEDLMKILIDVRAYARENKDWQLADMIRDRLSGAGVVITDRAKETSWEIKG